MHSPNENMIENQWSEYNEVRIPGMRHAKTIPLEQAVEPIMEYAEFCKNNQHYAGLVMEDGDWVKP